MKILLGTICSILFFIGVITETFAQRRSTAPGKAESLFQEALIQYQGGSSAKAIALLEQALKEQDSFYMAHFGLADIFHAEGKSDLEIEQLRTGLTKAGNAYPNGFKFLSQALYLKGEYVEAMDYANQFALLKKGLTADEKLLISSCRFAAEAVKNPVPFEPVNPGSSINSLSDDYWPSLNAESTELVFTRLIDRDSMGNRLQNPQEDFYRSVCDSGEWQMATAIGEPVNTIENEGAQCLSADGRLLFFTACGRVDGLGSCDIY